MSVRRWRRRVRRAFVATSKRRPHAPTRAALRAALSLTRGRGGQQDIMRRQETVDGPAAVHNWSQCQEAASAAATHISTPPLQEQGHTVSNAVVHASPPLGARTSSPFIFPPLGAHTSPSLFHTKSPPTLSCILCPEALSRHRFRSHTNCEEAFACVGIVTPHADRPAPRALFAVIFGARSQTRGGYGNDATSMPPHESLDKASATRAIFYLRAPAAKLPPDFTIALHCDCSRE